MPTPPSAAGGSGSKGGTGHDLAAGGPGNGAGGGGGGADGTAACLAGVPSLVGHAGGRGGNGDAVDSGGGGGGGAGAGMLVRTNGFTCYTDAGRIWGGTGGAGGRGTNVGGGAGGGGAGLHVAADDASITLEWMVLGGDGGEGGRGGDLGGGHGGDGGTGIFVRGNRNTIVVKGSVDAGGGGAGGLADGGGPAGADGATGASADIAGSGNALVLAHDQVTLYGDLRLGASNTLRGEGYVGGRVLAGEAVVVPGAAAATGGLYVGAGLDLRGGTLAVRIDAAAQRIDLVDVNNGGADITGARLRVNRLAGTPAVGQVYTLLKALDGITGTFVLDVAPGTLPPGTQARLVYLTAGNLTNKVNLEIVVADPALPPGPGGAVAVPALSPWSLGALGMLLAGGGLGRLGCRSLSSKRKHLLSDRLYRERRNAEGDAATPMTREGNSGPFGDHE
ncbi:hypothetical protein [Acidovorax sp. SDU_ACID1]|uniref:hypothetical protein n=1 Tax=Acidovorax sp. SDU_ACID1 TaxID=3136632 RepID=UPI003873C96E